MKNRQILISTVIIPFVAACLLQSSLTSCSREKKSDKAIEETAQTTSFLAGSKAEQATEWRAASESLLEDLRYAFKDKGIEIVNLERRGLGNKEARLTLGLRSNVSVEKQLLDGLYILFLTLPEQSKYEVRLDGEGEKSINATWEELQRLSEAGYSFESPSQTADRFMSIFNHQSEPPEQNEGMASAGASS